MMSSLPDIPLPKGVDLDYEAKRIKNIAENKAMLKKLLSELEGMPGIPKQCRQELKKSPKVKRTYTENVVRRCNPSRKARTLRSPPMTRSHHKRKFEEADVDDSEEAFGMDAKRSKSRLLIRFPGMKKKISHGSNSSDDDDSVGDNKFEVYDSSPNSTPEKKRRAVKLESKTVDEITEEDIENVAENVREKVYNSEYGTTCHQCRQKTLDMKTICRSESCFGVRGQFCGPCLRNRYGEDAKTCLKDPEWTCPPCRGNCNCSFCRKKKGRHATGILIHLAKHSGFNSVREYLESFASA
ncbi:cell division cycle-associated protein 7-like [Anneissia japonica]|uniref:cell division cycle-associated protein 7-like n=1 Tax=Anneissia japonica TaxID=1529436 RepID=UPI001425A00D|nr:cell division cycle-associated protein 7-like [Anneissia japonica]